MQWLCPELDDSVFPATLYGILTCVYISLVKLSVDMIYNSGTVLYVCKHHINIIQKTSMWEHTTVIYVHVFVKSTFRLWTGAYEVFFIGRTDMHGIR